MEVGWRGYLVIIRMLDGFLRYFGVVGVFFRLHLANESLLSLLFNGVLLTSLAVWGYLAQCRKDR